MAAVLCISEEDGIEDYFLREKSITKVKIKEIRANWS